ncbi:MAG: polyketide biosynthesis protein [Blastopirellula sp.]|nr:MAG: polyketide biosynthesis protein [Blastopirellula sp.]
MLEDFLFYTIHSTLDAPSINTKQYQFALLSSQQNPKMQNPIPLTIISDFACPWCYIGKRRLDEAIGQLPELDIVIDWQPFQLNPDMPRAGMNRAEYYQQKFGTEGRRNLFETLAQAGVESGIVFGNEPEAIAPNTLSAHVLMDWASSDAGNDTSIDSHALAEKLFQAHHVACENIGDHQVLSRISGEVGMNSTDVLAKLKAGEDEDKVQTQIQQATAQGISSVPFYIIGEQYALPGAQPAESLVSAFEQMVIRDH